MFVRTLTIDSIPWDEVTGSTYWSAKLGPLHIGEVVCQHELVLQCDDVGTGFYVQIPVTGRFESRHRGVHLMVNRMSVSLCQPNGGVLAGFRRGGGEAERCREERGKSGGDRVERM